MCDQWSCTATLAETCKTLNVLWIENTKRNCSRLRLKFPEKLHNPASRCPKRSLNKDLFETSGFRAEDFFRIFQATPVLKNRDSRAERNPQVATAMGDNKQLELQYQTHLVYRKYSRKFENSQNFVAENAKNHDYYRNSRRGKCKKRLHRDYGNS